jgi:hypothetical protein
MHLSQKVPFVLACSSLGCASARKSKLGRKRCTCCLDTQITILLLPLLVITISIYHHHHYLLLLLLFLLFLFLCESLHFEHFSVRCYNMFSKDISHRPTHIIILLLHINFVISPNFVSILSRSLLHHGRLIFW